MSHMRVAVLFESTLQVHFVLAMANLKIWWSWGADSREPATEEVVEIPAPRPRVAYLALREAAVVHEE
jgi:hypothetical protein